MAAYGFVYILFNPSMPGLLKLGCTNRAPHERARELSAPTGVPTCFQVMAYFEVENFQQVEHDIHIHCEHYRINEGREFFRMAMPELEDLVSMLMSVADSHYANQRIFRYHQQWCKDLGMAHEVEPMEAANA